MTNVNMTNIEELVNKFDNDVELINKELKRIQSLKCRLKKQKGRADYEVKMTDALTYEQSLKEARNLLEPKEKSVTMYEQADVDMLDYDETVKAIRSIQSKKALSRWLTDVEGDNDEFRNACRIEQMLAEHRDKIRPVEDIYIRKTDLQTVIDTIESSGKLTQDRIIELLKDLM